MCSILSATSAWSRRPMPAMATGQFASAALHRALLPVHCSWQPLSSSPSSSCGLGRQLQCGQASRRASLCHSSTFRVVAQKPDIYKAMGMAVRTAKDVLEAGTKLVPEYVPRPLAQAGVAVLGILGISYLLQSIFSIALFILAIGGVSYYILFLKKDDDERGGGGPSDSSSTDLTLEEARRIMDKYK